MRLSRFAFERLEDRVTPSWGSVPPNLVAVPAAFIAVTLNATGDASGTAAITANETDWYKFATPAGGATFSASTPTSSLDTVLAVYNAAGQRVAYNDDISRTNTDSQVRVTLAAGTYYLGVTNYNRTAGGGYTWAIDGPSAAPADDGYEENDTQATATDLGSLTAPKTVSGLMLADAADWYKFTTAGTGTAGTGVSISFTSTQGDLDLRLVNAAGAVVATSAGTGNSETVSLNGLAAGTYWAQVVGKNGAYNPGYALTVTPPAATSPPTTGGFAITLRTTGLTATQQAIFQQAADRWAQVITGDLPDATYNGIAVDDLLIDASGTAIDGAGGVLGQAGPDYVRAGSYLPIHGTMQFDTADLAALEANGGLYYTVLHEMGHVLGIGTVWSYLGLVSGAGGTNPLFVGPRATAEYNSIFGTSAAGVPLETTGGAGTRDSHWSEAVFGNEVMTGYLNSGANPLSRVTVASLADIGYVVSFTSADLYTPPGGTALLTTGGTATSGGTAGLRVGDAGLTPTTAFAPAGAHPIGRGTPHEGTPAQPPRGRPDEPPGLPVAEDTRSRQRDATSARPFPPTADGDPLGGILFVAV